jgi:glucuronoarabinoxylan endo-1,4-beta-xylanase
MKALRSAIASSLLLSLGLLAFAACNPDSSPGPQGDSHTNWLRRCGGDAECGELSCVCGLCTRSCSGASECRDAPGYDCFGADDAGALVACAGAEPPTGGMCLPSCSDSDCSPGFTCTAGACVPDPAPTVEVAVNQADRMQALVGFGATVGYAEDELSALSDRAKLDAAMFEGLGLDVLRIRNRYGEVSDAELARAQSLVLAATESLGRKPLVLLSSWSPPANLKQNGATFCGSGPSNCTLTLLPGGGFDYPGLAKHWRGTLDAYAKVGLLPDYIGIQNNPDWAPVAGAALEACKFLPSEGMESVSVGGVLTPVRYPGYAEALDAVLEGLAGLPSMPKLLAPDLAGVRGAERYFDALDTTRVDAIAHHMYGSDATNLDLASLTALGQLQASMALPIFQTEMQADGFDTALLIHHALVSEGAAMYLQTALVGARSGPATNSTALIGLEDGEFVLQEPYFAMRHYAKDTDPGYTRVGASSTEPTLLASAWLSPDSDGLTVVLINSGSGAQTVRLNVGDGRSFTLSRTVFGGHERTADLGTRPSGGSISLPPRSMATARFE